MMILPNVTNKKPEEIPEITQGHNVQLCRVSPGQIDPPEGVAEEQKLALWVSQMQLHPLGGRGSLTNWNKV